MKPRFNWRHQYDLDSEKKEGEASAIHCEDESLTQQQFTQDADLNVIARRFGINHPMDIPLPAVHPSRYRDTTEDPGLVDILNQRRAAKEAFMALPTRLRRRFHDSPAELWEFVNDPENAEEALRLGILFQTPTPTAEAAPTQPNGPAPSTETTGGSAAAAPPPENPPKKVTPS